MATYNKFYDFVEQLASAKHDLTASGHVLKVYLSNTQPTSGMTTKGDCGEITATMGYPTGGSDITNAVSESNGTLTMTGADVTFTATGGSFGPFRYAIVYNSTQTTPSSPLVCWWDYASSISCNAGETFTVDFGASVLTLS